MIADIKFPLNVHFQRTSCENLMQWSRDAESEFVNNVLRFIPFGFIMPIA